MSLQLLYLALLALVLLHEAAHAATAQALGLRWRPFLHFPGSLGIAVWVETRRQSRLLACSGPCANLLAALVLWLAGQGLLALISLALALLPSLSDWRSFAHPAAGLR